MSAGVEVAEDYKASLEYLTTNDRYAINNLTVIAKENTEHADAISKVLEEHIRKVSRLCSFVSHLNL
jgi:pre-mRNA cleavage complex 2 protein Pcf11